MPHSSSDAASNPSDEPPIDEPWISDDLAPDVLDGPSDDAGTSELSPTLKRSDAHKRPQKHSAELFPIPPAAPNAAESHADGAGSAENSGGEGGKAPSYGVGPLPLVETAFLASAASLMWLVNTYFPPGPLLRILFPLPIALVYLRWNVRSAWMAATVSGLLLTILLGPTRSIFFVMPYALLGVQLGCLWRRKASWNVSILTGGLLVALGSFFRVWLLSLLAGEDLWGYSIAQITQLLSWAIRKLTNWGLIGLGSLGQPGLGFVSVAAVVMIVFASVVYLFTVHLAAWLLLERLGVEMPEPPGWVQVLIEE
ncbi:MAG: DUF2232 domain-containing protein [Cyanobacteria bacterium J06588_5]